MTEKRVKSLNPLLWLNSVPLGIVLMVLTAVYIAVGSGRPWLREYGIDQLPGLRYWFDLSDMQFFDAWPLKTIMALLVANLVIVTVRRIPLTPPRYGVWCIHTGIITLILSTTYYYNQKFEGRVRLYTKPETGLNVADHYYDKDERSLYLKIGNLTTWYPLPMLPRFKEYDAGYGNVDALKSRGLFSQEATLSIADATTGKPTFKNVSEFFGGKDQLRFDVVGYYPYAGISTTFAEDPTSTVSGMQLTLPDLQNHGGEGFGPWWLIASDPRFSHFPFASDFGVDLEPVQGDSAMVTGLTEAAGKIFQLDVKVAGDSKSVQDHTESIFVQSGKTYTIGQTGYSFIVENYNPAFPMSGTGEIAKVLTVKVTSPKQTFRRMVLEGKPLQTDFKLDVEGAGPMGKRQKEPLDNQLSILFSLHDPFHLLPREGLTKHTLVSLTDSPAMVDVVSGLSSAGQVNRFENGSGDVFISTPEADPAAPFAPSTTAPATANHPKIRLHVERKDHLRAVDSVRPVLASRRDRNAEEEGVFQVAKVKMQMGNWSEEVIVPYADQAYESAQNDNITQPWAGGLVHVPGMTAPIQLQLGNTRRELPAKLTLNKFELVPYPGGHADARSLMLDFRSTLTIEDPATAERFTDVAHMNSPIYYRNGKWLFFQAAYDGRDHEWTQLGVGNRPGVDAMITGCVMIFVGLMYAFYAKPIVIRKMKEKAIARAMAKKSTVATSPV